MPDQLTGEPGVEYVSNRNNGMYVAIALVIGFISSGFILLVMFVAIATAGPGKSSSPTFIGALSIVPVFAFLYAIRLMKSAVRVTVAAAGITLHGFASRKYISFSDIVSLKRNKQQGVESVDIVIICDAKGKELGRISSILTGFPQLVQLIEDRSAMAVGHQTYDRDKDMTERKNTDVRKLRRNGIILIVFAFFSLALGTWGAVEYYFKSQLHNHGTEIQAKIVRHYMYNVTPRLEYSFKAKDGSEHSNDVMMGQSAWDALKNAKTVKVKYLEASPSWNSLAAAASDTDDNLLMIIIGLAGIIIFAPIAIIALKGYDVVSENGKIFVRKAGDISDQFESEENQGPSGTPPPMPQFLPSRPEDAAGGREEVPQGASEAISRIDIPETAALPLPPLPGPSAGSPAVPLVDNKTPGGIIAFGIINIVFGLITLMVNFFRVVFAALSNSDTMNLGDMQFEFDGFIMVVFALFSSGAAMLLLISAPGLFKMRKWGRTLALIAGWWTIAMDIAGIAATIIPAISAGTDNLGQIPKAPYVAGIIGSVIFSLILMIYPIVMVLVLSKRDTKQLFNQNYS